MAKRQKRFAGEKIYIFRQAILHALRVSSTRPLDISRKVFFLEFKLKANHQTLPPEDQYTLIKGQMYNKDDMFDDEHPLDGDACIKLQHDTVTSRGQLGVVPVMMIDKDGEAKAVLPLALPFTLDQAQACLKACGWDEEVFWVSYTLPFLYLLIDDWYDLGNAPSRDVGYSRIRARGGMGWVLRASGAAEIEAQVA